MNNQCAAFIENRRGLDEKPAGMEKRQNNQHDVIEVKFKKNISVQAVKKSFAVGKHGTFWQPGGAGCVLV